MSLTDPLPRGTTVLEASAGTGKTYTIAGLATRYVAEGHARLPQLLILTFTRAATAELRERVRRRLVTATTHLEAVLAGGAPSTSDPVLGLIADVEDDELALRHARLSEALTEFDAATISTIHGFCQHVLQGLGLASDLERDAELVEDLADLVEETVDDCLVRRFHGGGDGQLPRRKALEIARVVMGNPITPLLPLQTDNPIARLRVDLAYAIRDDAERRKRRSRRISYDDLLTRLRAAVLDEARGHDVRRAIRDHYTIALIDEFQDTDPVQWDILRATFEDADGSALVLIGDPKQAIYAFRGADVYAYLAAVRTPSVTRRTLGTNWRSDARLLRALECVLAGATFGEDDIAFRPVDHAPAHADPRLVGAPVDAAFRLRLVPRHDRMRVYQRKINADQARNHIADDVADDIVTLLSSDAHIVDRDADGTERRDRVAPGDVAVLVRSNDEAARVHAALVAAGVPAIINGVGSVFETAAASDWLRLLEAIERPASGARVRALALSAFVGWNGDRVAAASDDDWDDLHDAVHHWTDVLRNRDVTSLLRTVVLQQRVHARLLGRPDGERHVTDLEHIGEQLHAAAAAEHLGPTALTSWLRARIDEARRTAEGDDEKLRRLESDDDAVQILTIHRAKGLQFPIVYVPFLWSSGGFETDIHSFHGPDGARTIDVGGEDTPEANAHRERAEHEERGEQLRLLYVALTRAEHQVVAYYAPAGKPEWSAMGRVLLNRVGRDTCVTTNPSRVLDDDRILELCRSIEGRAEGTFVVETTPPQPVAGPWSPRDAAQPDLRAAPFERPIDTAWHRTSYSAVAADPRSDVERKVASEPETDTTDDEPSVIPLVADDDLASLHAHASPWSDLAGGAEVGTFVHAVLEGSDWAADDLDDELTTHVARQAQRRQLDIADAAPWVSALMHVIATPLGPLTDGRTLASFPRRDRRDEMAFELPLAGGVTPTTRVRVGDIAHLLRTHLPHTDPLAGYADDLPTWMLERDLRGFLTGSIDVVLRVDDRYVVVDHKTNRLAPRDEPLTAWHYRPAALAEAMRHSHYPLQALLYSAALHRYLRWRVAGYDAARHLGGVLYLFVRGMLGADTPTVGDDVCGVFTWRPPSALVTGLSDLLDGAEIAA
ncbi:MAG: UvrD-helicase domain-containing protein [Actinobacteria bacterium]|nr:UvrD-helicase domain-containing protein [Actinomycetota bacterium]